MNQYLLKNYTHHPVVLFFRKQFLETKANCSKQRSPKGGLFAWHILTAFIKIP